MNLRFPSYPFLISCRQHHPGFWEWSCVNPPSFWYKLWMAWSQCRQEWDPWGIALPGSALVREPHTPNSWSWIIEQPPIDPMICLGICVLWWHGWGQLEIGEDKFLCWIFVCFHLDRPEVNIVRPAFRLNSKSCHSNSNHSTSLTDTEFTQKPCVWMHCGSIPGFKWTLRKMHWVPFAIPWSTSSFSTPIKGQPSNRHSTVSHRRLW